MNLQQQFQNLLANLAKLGWKKLAALGLVGVTVAAVVGFSGYWLSRPAFDVLYAGLDRQDVASIGSALTEAGIPFDVSSDGASVKVRFSEAARARMLLAEKGLPHSANSGYELYDKLGSLGLTSFMQDVTRVRATEGELARTIQLMNGIRAARVHIVLPDEGSFRRARQAPSASVMIRTDMIADARTGQAIRHLVAAAVPGMTVDEVTVLNTDGTLLTSAGETEESSSSKMLTLEKGVSKDIQDNIRKELAPYLGLHNFQIAVAAKLNSDARQTNETIYNPDSKVERSTRVVKENQSANNSISQPPTSVSNALPQSKAQSSTDSKSSATENTKREELTNYELSSKVISTTSAGYQIDRLSIAVLVNRSSLGANGAPFDSKLADIESLITSATGLRKDRGDTIKVLAVDFSDAGHDLEPVPSTSAVDVLLRQSGTAINAITVLVVAGLLIFFVLRPAMRSLTRDNDGVALPISAAPMAALGAPDSLAADGGQLDTRIEPSLIEDVTAKTRRTPQRRLEQMVEFDETHAAAILKQWLRGGSVA